MIQAVRHTGLVVRDLNRSVRFYEGLGLEVQARKRESGAYIDAVIGLQDADLEWAKLSAPDGALVELIQYHSHPEPPRSPRASAAGCSHMAFTVRSMEEALEAVEFLGGSRVGQVATDPPGRHRVIYCADPDGIIIELVEVQSA
ncbi:MAG: glyoxalase [Rhodothermales bacterium]|nr:glyoxalase [Rhodothermales bacterium]